MSFWNLAASGSSFAGRSTFQPSAICSARPRAFVLSQHYTVFRTSRRPIVRLGTEDHARCHNEGGDEWPHLPERSHAALSGRNSGLES